MKRVSKSKPCPICGRPDWCGIAGDDSLAICMRVESSRPSKNGGWVHILKQREYHRRPQRIALHVAKAAEARNASGLAEQVEHWRQVAEHGGWLEHLSDQLGVSVEALLRFGVGWNPQESVWTWPLRDAGGRIVGVNRRFLDGAKRVMPGTHVGLYVPEGLIHTYRSLWTFPLLLVEGGSDAAAGHDLGLPTIGRFSCTGQQDMLADLVRTIRPGVVVIVADADGPGRFGAERLAHTLRPLVRALKIVEPPAIHKDLRAWRQAGATDGDLIRLINETPTRPLRMEVKHA